ncbi:MAG: NAD(+) synthetase [Candidatus Glassbacteria bacterium RBG_16_58_8]|uniref:NH(3)-dependent NAD(+) synthetase n=1 Tax=Candidatus Glassbacteria bacterium RBG_16_58_8 TaxID=1817866 RepID=A0A1F5YB38_9BACT|nr:MAG: NAD(+) synthetase [Candidatus Glassbacteria bacterium RBG_16_58_8]
MSELSINNEQVAHVLCGFISSEIRKFGYDRVVVGLSGGVDSSTSAFLAVRALGKENIIGILMPYKTSQPESRDHAMQVVDALGIRSLEVDITPMVNPYFALHPDMDRIRRGNVMARERMIVLYDQSHARKALVLGTSNKTEYLLGYTTLWGDMACAVNPLGDLYKTQVRSLARYLGVPGEIIRKPPSADLWKGQTDEEELGFTYEEVDRLLFHLIDKRLNPAELEEKGFQSKFVKRVTEMIQKSQYKRHLPVIAKLSDRTIDWDFRYPRDWGA